MMNRPVLPRVKMGSLNSRSGRMGSVARRSIITKANKEATDRAAKPMISSASPGVGAATPGEYQESRGQGRCEEDHA